MQAGLCHSAEEAGISLDIYDHVAYFVASAIHLTGIGVCIVTDGNPVFASQVNVGCQAEVQLALGTAVDLLGHPTQSIGIAYQIETVLAHVWLAAQGAQAGVGVDGVRLLHEALVLIEIAEVVGNCAVAVLAAALIHGTFTVECGHFVGAQSLVPGGILRAVAVDDIAKLAAAHCFGRNQSTLIAVVGSTIDELHLGAATA